MSDLAPTTALGGAEPRLRSFGTLALTENSGLALASLAQRRGAVPPKPFGLALPDIGRITSTGDTFAFWTGPEQWMIGAQDKADTDVARALKLEAPEHFVAEQTDAWVAVDIRGRAGALRAMFEKLVNVPHSSLGVGCAVRCGMHHLNVFVLRPDEEQITVLGMRSAAQTLWDTLAVTAARIGVKDTL